MGFNGEPMVGVRISVGGEFWTGAEWRAAKVLSAGERPPPNEFLSAAVAKNPNGYQWGWSWSLTKHLPEGSNLPDGFYGVSAIIRQAPGYRDGRGIRIDRQGPTLAIVSPPQTEKPGLKYHHDVGDPYLIGPKGVLPVISGTAYDPSGPIRAEVFFQRQEDRWWWQGDRWFRRRSPACDVTVSNSSEWRCGLVPPPDSLRSGGYQITVEAADGLGNRTQTPALRNVVVPLRQLEATKHPQPSDRPPEWRKR